MHFHHPPAKKYRLLPQEQSPMETVVLHLSPYGIGRMGGEMAKRMVDAAQGYLEEVTTRELHKAFRKEIYQNLDMEKISHSSWSIPKSPVANVFSPSGGEVLANQYPSGNDTH